MNIGIYKRGDIWHYRFTINKDRHRGSTGTKSRKLARAYVDNLYTSLYYDQNRIKKPRTEVKDFIVYHLESDKNNLSRDWYHIKSAMLSRFLNYLQGENLGFLDEIELEHIEKFKAELLESHKPKTVKNNIVVMSSLFNHAVKLNYIATNPVKGIAPIKQIQRNKKRFLSNDDITKLLYQATGTFLFGLIYTAIYTGMRRGELINLEYSDIDYEKKLIYVRNKDGFSTKSRKERVLPIHKELYTLFGKKNKGYCFCNKKGGKLHIDVLKLKFRDIVDKAGLEDVTPHVLRHTFISHALMAGISPWEIGKWVGHSSVYITELYGHLCPDRREIDKLKI